MQRKIFFDRVREDPFSGSLSQLHVDGMSAILDEWEQRKLPDVRWLAYMLATTFHETAGAMQPVEEWGKGKNKRYGLPDPETGKTYYGRGFVQLTWKFNYAKMSVSTREDLVHFPEKALKLAAATVILFEGMIHGMFTGKKLSDYFNDVRDEPENARRIINGLDRAYLVAGYHRKFLEAIHFANEKPK